MKTDDSIFDVAITGGGLAGLSAAILLARKGYKVILFEIKTFPFHRVCGEFVSEESRPFLEELGIPISVLSLPLINKLLVSAPSGDFIETELTPGGFGISRYRLDYLLSELAKSSGVLVMEATKVTQIRYDNGVMLIGFLKKVIRARVAIGAFGKRANLDIAWKRQFSIAREGKLNNYVGVKYHIRINEPGDRIALHNFKNGYCGLSKIEDDRFCLCYLTLASNIALSNNSIEKMEEAIVKRNPFLEKIFNSAEFIWPAPVIISQVSFLPKSQVQNHVLLVGDAAGLITPLCGNGMSMALYGSKILSGLVSRYLQNELSRNEMEHQYAIKWNKEFGRRMQAGRIIQRFFGDPVLTKGLILTASLFPSFTRFLVRQTHGDQF